MTQLFHKKSTSILTVAAILLVAVLLCTLLITLSQKVSLDDRINKLLTLVEAAKTSNEAKRELYEFCQTDAYVAKWAEEQGLVKKDDITFVEKPGQGK